MSTSRIATLTRTAAVAAFVGLAVAGGAGLAAAQAPAHATSQDKTFLNTLDKQGISYDSSANAISAGHYVCNSFDSGATFTSVAHDVLAKSSLSEYNTGFFVAASVLVYCPEYTSALPS